MEADYQPGEAPGDDAPIRPRAGGAPGLEHIAWYGRGPAETYVDRAFERVGVYTSTVSGEWVEYPQPQENGNKADVRWVELTNPQGIGLRAEGLPLLSVEAHHASRLPIERAAYTYQITQHPEVYLNLDFKQMGGAGSTAGPARPIRWSLTGFRVTSRIRTRSACGRSQGSRGKTPSPDTSDGHLRLLSSSRRTTWRPPRGLW